MANIRAATLDDLDSLLELGAVMHAESPRFNPHPFMPERLRTSLSAVMAMPMGRIFVAVEAGEIVGVMVAIASEHYACNLLQACDLALFVYPRYRGGTAGPRLVRAYVAWANSIGAEPTIGINTGVEPERTGQLLKALGATASGTNWTWGI